MVLKLIRARSERDQREIRGFKNSRLDIRIIDIYGNVDAARPQRADKDRRAYFCLNEKATLHTSCR